MAEVASRAAKALALFFIVLGAATITTSAVAWTQMSSESLYTALLSFVYGVAAVVAGIALRRQSRVARLSYVLWCATIPLFLMTVPQSLDPYLIPGYLGMIALLTWGYFFIGRHTRHASVDQS